MGQYIKPTTFVKLLIPVQKKKLGMSMSKKN